MAPRSAALWLAMAVSSASVLGCDFDRTLDPNTQMQGLTQDYNAYSLDVCKSNCCEDTSCEAYQFQQGFHGMMSCFRGPDGGSGQPAGGMPWQGEAGRGKKDGDGKSGGGGGPGGVDEYEDARAAIFTCAFFFCGYLMLGTMHGQSQGRHGTNALPHAFFWQNLHGLVIDGYHFFFYAQAGKPPYTALADDGGPSGAGVTVTGLPGSGSQFVGSRDASAGAVGSGGGLGAGPPAAAAASSRGGQRAGGRGGAARAGGGGRGAGGRGSGLSRAAGPAAPAAAVAAAEQPAAAAKSPRQKLRKKKGANAAAKAPKIRKHDVHRE